MRGPQVLMPRKPLLFCWQQLMFWFAEQAWFRAEAPIPRPRRPLTVFVGQQNRNKREEESGWQNLLVF